MMSSPAADELISRASRLSADQIAEISPTPLANPWAETSARTRTPFPSIERRPSRLGVGHEEVARREEKCVQRRR